MDDKDRTAMRDLGQSCDSLERQVRNVAEGLDALEEIPSLVNTLREHTAALDRYSNATENLVKWLTR
jgi:hypothetical protein